MTLLRPYSADGALPRARTRLAADALVLAGMAALFWLLIRLSHGVEAPFNRVSAPSTVSTDPANLPYYAARSLLRMFVALGVSTVFTFVYATAAARLRRAEKILLPILDVLQSVPVLGFLSVTLAIWLTLFPHTMLGVECAAVFAIFTSQAWNMTFAFYNSLVTQPRELDEAARMLRLTRVAAVLEAGRAQRDDPAGLERDDELRWRLVLPGRVRGDQRQQPHLRPARYRQLRRRGQRQPADRAAAARDRGHDRHGDRRSMCCSGGR